MLENDIWRQWELQVVKNYSHPMANGFIIYDRTVGGYDGYRLTIKHDGDVGIGNYNPQYKLDVSGDVRADDYHEYSDERLNSNIAGIENSLSVIKKIDGITYNKIPSAVEQKSRFSNDTIDSVSEAGNIETSDKKDFGFSAQEIRKILPELVSEDNNGYLSVRYNGFIPILVEALKEQDQKITELENRISKLEQEKVVKSATIVSKNSYLEQNAPNPFDTETVINYSIDKNITGAAINIYDLNGKQVLSKPVNSVGTGSITISSAELFLL
jgi:DNA-binding transcriptional MerR regulator